jgi:hypothetical protein
LRSRTTIPVAYVAVDDAQTAGVLDALQVVVHEVVPPAVQLVRGRQRSVGELEERAIQRVVVRQPAQAAARAEQDPHLLLERPRVQPVDVVVAVVREEQPALLHEVDDGVTLVPAEADQRVSCHEEERKGEQLGGVGADHDLVRIDGNGRVLHDRVEDAGRQGEYGADAGQALEPDKVRV